MESVISDLNLERLLIAKISNVAIFMWNSYLPSLLLWSLDFKLYFASTISMIHFFCCFTVLIFGLNVSWLSAVWMDSQFLAQLDLTTWPRYWELTARFLITEKSLVCITQFYLVFASLSKSLTTWPHLLCITYSLYFIR